MNSPAIEEKNVTLATLRVATRVLDAGTGSPVVLLHGNPDDADEWRPLIDRLSQRHRCIAPDFPGYGKSPEPPSSFTYSVADQVAFLDALLTALDVREKVVLVVHDIGGILGVPWAAQNAARLHGLMVTNTVAFEGFRWFSIARRWGDDSWLGRMRARAMMAALALRRGALFKKPFWAQSPQLSEVQIDRIVSTFALNRTAKSVTLRQFRQIMKPGFFAGFDAMRKQIGERVPVRVLWGDGDLYVPTRYAQAFPGAQVTVLPDVGHWVPLVASEKLAAEIELLAGT